MSSSSLRDTAETGLVLILEDEPVLRASIARGLAKLPGIEIVEAGSVREAKELVRALDPHLLLCDLDLPDGSGIEVAAELARCGKRVPIVFVSAYVRRFVRNLPPDVTVIEKPVPLERLRQLVVDHVGTSRLTPPPFSAVDYIQLASMARRSVLLEMRRNARLVGSVVLYNGEVWHAEDERGEGLSAFRRLVLAKGLEATCRSLPRPPDKRTVEGSCEHVLLEAMQAFDEGKLAPDEQVDFDEAAWDEMATGKHVVQVLDSAGAGSIAAKLERKLDPLADRTMSGLRPAVARAPTPSEIAARGALKFDVLFERGVEALLSKDYPAAMKAFTEAEQISPGDSRVAANLKRLRELGFGGDA